MGTTFSLSMYGYRNTAEFYTDGVSIYIIVTIFISFKKQSNAPPHFLDSLLNCFQGLFYYFPTFFFYQKKAVLFINKNRKGYFLVCA